MNSAKVWATREEMTQIMGPKRFLTVLILSLMVAACGSKPSSSKLKEEWNRENDPLNFLPTDFERTLSALPNAGMLEKQPWSDSYWPSYLGGIALRWNNRMGVYEDSFRYRPLPFRRLRRMNLPAMSKLSPAEKFDLLNSDYTYTLLRSERARTNPSAPTWEGLCHGWATAALTVEEPKAVLMTNAEGLEIPFGSADIKALVDLYVGNYSNARTYFVAERCNTDLNRNPEAVGTPECRDTNAGTFHLVLANQIGVKHEGFVADITRDLMVWNQPIIGFESTIINESDSASPGAAPNTVKEVTLKTKMTYMVEAGAHWEHGITNLRSKDYEYRLELNAAGQIIGGAWLTEDRPDFLWKQEAPTFDDVEGLRFSSLKTILEKSSQAPTDMPNPIGG